MDSLPEAFDEGALPDALAEFGVEPASTEFLPVGFGDYHWKISGTDGGRWFATLSDLERKEHCGHGAVAAAEGLRRAMTTAATLRERDGLEFVVAPVRAASGDAVVLLRDRFALCLFPYLPAVSGDFGQDLGAGERNRILDLLADLHRCAPPESTPLTSLDPVGRDQLDTALDGREADADGGPFSAPARGLLAEHASAVRGRLAEFDRLADEVCGRGLTRVVTHGEPHPGNVLAHHEKRHLVDWDTVGLAVPERDLSVLSTDPSVFAHYTDRTGYVPDADALSLYALRWTLVDLAEFVAWFREPHSRTPDTEAAWHAFRDTLGNLATPPS